VKSKGGLGKVDVNEWMMLNGSYRSNNCGADWSDSGYIPSEVFSESCKDFLQFTTKEICEGNKYKLPLR
jgi:hypothetical protein